MPRYFFAVDGSRLDPEQVGLDLPGPEAARDEAVRAMADLIADIDGAGQTVGTLHFRGERGPEG